MKNRLFIIGLLLCLCAGVRAQDVDLTALPEITNAMIEAEQQDSTNVEVKDSTSVVVIQDSTFVKSEGVNELKNEGVVKPQQEKKVSKGLLFFYRTGNWVDNYLRKGIDTSYIDLPEHSWRVAVTSGTLGINTSIASTSDPLPEYTNLITMSLYNRTYPSADLGFYAGYRGFGFGYSWDLLHAYSQRLSFSFGSKFIGLDFGIHTSTNIHTTAAINDVPLPSFTQDNAVVVTNANLSVWYALNAAHYNHNATIKQSYIQKKTAGSLLLQASYMYSHIQLDDTTMVPGATKPTFPAMMNGMNGLQTRQIGIGIGYGINYTPNHGKVVLHASATAMLVTYTVNHISYYIPDSLKADLPSSDPMFRIQAAWPVHITGNVRAAISWEINKYVHLSAWATGDHIRFKTAKAATENVLALREWNWHVQVTVGVRFGAGKDRVQRALLASGKMKGLEVKGEKEEHKKSRLPQWLTDFFWSPKD